MNAVNKKNSVNIDRAVSAFANAKLDISAVGLMSVLRKNETLTIDEIIHQLKPRDYDIGLSEREFSLIIASL
jgi:hypothetical protein